MFNYFRKELDWGGRKLILETGKIARQADGAVLARYGDTIVLCTAVGREKLSRVHEPDRARGALPAPSGGWRQDRWSGHCAAPANPRNGAGGHICLKADPPARCRFRIAAAVPTRSSPCNRAASSTRNHNAGLRAAIDFPPPKNIERLAIHDEDARGPFGTILAAAAERADINAFRSAMDRVRRE